MRSAVTATRDYRGVVTLKILPSPEARTAALWRKGTFWGFTGRIVDVHPFTIIRDTPTGDFSPFGFVDYGLMFNGTHGERLDTCCVMIDLHTGISFNSSRCTADDLQAIQERIRRTGGL